MAKYYPFSGQTFTLGSSISSTATSIILSSFIEPVTGTPYTMALINSDIVYATISPKTSNSELISFTGITQNADGTATLTGVTRGLAKKYPFTTSSSYKLPHAGQSQFIISDAPQVFQEFVSIVNDETIGGIKTFTSFPITPSSAPTTDYQAANKKYVDDTAFAGAPNASTTQKGIVEEATQAEVDAGTAAGGTLARLFINPSTHRGRLFNDYAVDSVGTDSYAIAPTPAITAYVTGQVFVFKAGTANTGAATLAVSGLTAKAIVKNFNAALETGDIVAGQVITVVYESVGDNFQFQTSNLIHTHQSTAQGGTLDAAAIAAGTVATARLGSGSASSSTFLRGDQTYANPISGLFGAWTTATADGNAHQVTTDGIIVWVLARASNTANTDQILSDSSSSPTTVRAQWTNGTNQNNGITMTLVSPIRKNDYYKLITNGVESTTYAYFIPLGN